MAKSSDKKLQDLFYLGYDTRTINSPEYRGLVKNLVDEDKAKGGDVQGRNTDAMIDLYNQIQFSPETDNYKQDPISKYAMDDMEFRAHIPFGHEKTYSLGGDHAYSMGLNAINVRKTDEYLEPVGRGRVFVTGRPAGNEDFRIPTLRHEGQHDLNFTENEIRQLDQAYNEKYGGKSFEAVLGDSPKKPAVKAANLESSAYKLNDPEVKEKLGKFYDNMDEDSATRYRKDVEYTYDTLKKLTPDQIINMYRFLSNPSTKTGPGLGQGIRMRREKPYKGIWNKEFIHDVKNFIKKLRK